MIISNFRKFSGHGSTVTKLGLGLHKLGYEVAIGAYSFDHELPNEITKVNLKKFSRLSSQDSCKNYEIIHNHHSKMNYHSLFTSKPFIFHLHGAADKKQELNLKFSIAVCKKRIKHIIAISNTVVNQIKNVNDEIPIEVIYLGVDTDFYHPNLSRDFKKGEPQLLFVGVLFPHKNLDFLIDVMPLVIKKYPNAHLQIVGEGQDYNTLNLKIKKMGLSKNIELTGRISDEELKLRYASCDMYISPSKHEMLDLPSIEVMACGKPVVLSNIDVHSEIVNASKAGRVFLLEKEDVVNQISATFESRHKLGALARSFALQNDWSKVSVKVSKVYSNVLTS